MSCTMVDPKSTPGENGKTKTNQDHKIIVVTCEDVAPEKEVAEQHTNNPRAKSPTWRGTSPKHRQLSPNWRKPPTKDQRAVSPNWREDINGRSCSPNTRDDKNRRSRSPKGRDDKNGGARSPNGRDDKNAGARSPNWRHPSPNNEIGRSLSPNWRKPSPQELRSSSPNWRASSNPTQKEKLRSSSPNWRASSNPSQKEISRSPQGRGRSGRASGEKSKDEVDARNSNTVATLDSSNFSNVLESSLPWLVMFSAPWCGPSRKMKPAFEMAANKLKGKVRFGILNGDLEQNQDLVGSFASEGFPSLYHFPANGGTPEMYGGGRKAEEIIKWARAFILNYQ